NALWRESYPDLVSRQSIYDFLYANTAETRIAPVLNAPYIFHTCDDTRQAASVANAHIVCLRTKVDPSNVDQPGAKLAVYSQWATGTTMPGDTTPEYEFYDYNSATSNNRGERGNDYYSSNTVTQNTIAQYLSVLGGWSGSDTGLIRT